jgi:hypothetical protein
MPTFLELDDETKQAIVTIMRDAIGAVRDKTGARLTTISSEWIDVSKWDEAEFVLGFVDIEIADQ